MKIEIWVVVAVIAGLVLGGLFGSLLFPKEVEKIVEKKINVEVPVDKIVYQNVTVEKVVNKEVQPDYRSLALKTVRDEIGDEDSFLNCSGYIYEEDELKRITFKDNWSYTNLNTKDSNYLVEFEARFRFDNDKDDGLCTETRQYQVEYDENEDPIVELV